MAYEMVMPYHLHMPSYFLETFTEYPHLQLADNTHTKHTRGNNRLSAYSIFKANPPLLFKLNVSLSLHDTLLVSIVTLSSDNTSSV